MVTCGISHPELLKGWTAAQAKGLTQTQHAAELGMEFGSYKNHLYRAQCEARYQTIEQQYPYELGKPWQLEGDWVVVGDVHVPLTDWEFAAYPAMMGKRYLKKPRRLLVGGDFLNMDTFSLYAQIVEPPTWAQERAAAKDLLNLWLDTFDEIRILMGNHERRVQKFTAGAFDEIDILGLIKANPDKVKMSNFGHCMIGDWRITHPKNYSINALTVPDTLAQKFNCNIIGFHGHHLGIGWDRYGRHLIVEGGALVDQEKLAYVQMDDNKSATMKKGFCVLMNGTPYLFGESPFTDWSKWL